MQNCSIQYLPYTKFLTQNYRALSKLPGFVLLESSDKQRGRYDILSAYPYEKLCIDEKNASLAFSQLEESLNQRQSDLDLPFQGGAIGYISYDLATNLAKIPPSSHNLFPNMPLMEMGFYDWAIIVDHEKQKVIVFSRNEHSSTAAIIPEVLNVWKNIPYLSYEVNSSWEALVSKEFYQKSFNAILQDIQKGRSYQVNYTQPFSTYFKGDSFGLYETIKSHNPIPFGAYLQTSYADILCFSPERLVRMEKNVLLASPIKGTIQSSTCEIEDKKLRLDLQNSLKNRAENVMIVDLLRNDLGKIAKPGSVKVTSLCALQSYRGLHHLVSDIEAICLDNISPIQAFKACFPGGSITGAPKLEAMRVIQEQEPFNRGVYCGNIGYFSCHGNFDFNIAIRTITARNQTLYLNVGGGLLIDSDCEDEYQECFTKISAIQKALKIE